MGYTKSNTSNRTRDWISTSTTREENLIQTPSETAVAAVECYLEGNHEGFIRYYEDLVLSGISPRAIDRLMEKAGLPPSDQLKKAEPPADFLHHGGFGGSGFRLPEIISTA